MSRCLSSVFLYAFFIVVWLPEFGHAETTDRGYTYLASTKICSASGKCEEHLNINCEPKPTLKAAEVAEITEKAGMWKPKNGSWKIEYIDRAHSRENPFPDKCFWKVQTMAPTDGDILSINGDDTTYIQDNTKIVSRNPVTPFAIMHAKAFEHAQTVKKGRIGILMVPKGTTLSSVGQSLTVDRGLMVVLVFDGSAAEKAGLLEGDQILKINGQDIGTIDDVFKAIDALPPQTTVPFRIWRGREMDVSVKL